MTPVRCVLAACLALLAPAVRADGLGVFFWGNSLLNHPSESGETSVPFWLARLARAGGHELRADGAWGFLPELAAALPPEPEWAIPGVERAWDPEATAFRMAGFDAAVVGPTNFIQGDPPDADVQGGRATELVGRVMAWAENQMPDADPPRLLLYEGWGRMEDFGPYPPSARTWERWHRWNLGGFHDWTLGLQARLDEELGDGRVELIPTARVLSTLLTEPPLDARPATAFLSDGAPHGTPTTYLLAAMAVHAALWGEAPPPIELPPSIDPALRENYLAVSARVAELMGVPPPRAARATPADPSMAINLAGISDWSTEQPFIDLMRTARPWIGHEGAAWGAWDAERLRAGGFLTPEGWPRAMPPGVDRLEALVLTDQPPDALEHAGTYVLRWEGGAEMSVGGLARDAVRDGNAIRFGYAPGPGAVAVAVTALDPSEPLRRVTLVREENEELWEAGAVFDPRFLDNVRAFRALRFMDWMDTNGSEQVTWEDRPRLDDATWAADGVPVEVMVALANEAGADPWFTLPAKADDAYVEAFASYVRDALDPRLRVQAEWSNEVWNFIMPQARWAAEQARARWGEGAPDDAWMQWAGMRAAEVAEVWARVFADDPSRLVRVVGVHTGWPGLEDALLDAPLAVAEGRRPPSDSFDAYAVTGYFGADSASEEQAPTLRAAIADGTAAALLTARARADIARLRDELWPRHAAAAARRGLRLVAYEGGPHIVPEGSLGDDPAVLAFLAGYNYSDDMARLNRELLAAWDAVGGTLFAPFVDVAPPSRWGAWGALRHPADWTGRWKAIMDANARAPTWEERDVAAFADGVMRRGTDGPDRIEGTPEEDDLLGAGGDDVLVPGGGADRVHGGEGLDRALLPGAAADWSRARDGAATVLRRGRDEARLVAVEEIVFEGSGEVVAVGAP